MQADVIIRPVDATGLRGLVAARDFQTGDTVISLPFSLALNLGPASWSAAVRRALLGSPSVTAPGAGMCKG